MSQLLKSLILTCALCLIFIVVNAQCPDPVTTNDSAICYGTLNLTVGSSTGNYAWYADATGGPIVDTGATYTTPGSFTTDTFYATAFDTITDDALDLDGTNDYVSIQNYSYSSSGITELTVEAWIRTSSGASQIIASYDRSEYWRFEINGASAGTGQIGLGINTNAGLIDFGGNTRIDDGNWHHVAATFDNGTITLYVDGVVDASTTNGATYGNGTTRFGFVGVGSEANTFDGTTGPAVYFNGDMDEFRIWSVARSASEVSEFKDKCAVGETGLEVYYRMDNGTGASVVTDRTGNGNNGTLKNMNPANDWINGGLGIFGCCESSRIPAIARIDSVDGTGLTASADTNCGPGTVNLSASGSSGNYNWYDQSTGGNLIAIGANVTSPQISTSTDFYLAAKDSSIITNAILFDGNDDYIAIDNFFYNSSGLTAMTVETWLNTSDGSDQIIASFDRSEFWRLEVNGDGGGTGQIGFDINTSSGILDFGSTTRIDDGNWHHVAAVFDNGLVSIYIDGVLDNSTNTGATFGVNATRYGFLGTGSEATTFNGTTGPNNYYNGQLDDFRIWNKAKTQAEIVREMSECLQGDESNLQVYYTMDDQSGTTLSDLVASADGTLINFSPVANAWTNTGPQITGCCETGRVAVTATILPLPSIDLGSDFCSQGATVLDAGGGFVSYLWSTTETSQTININGGNFYWARIEGSNGCFNSDTVQVAVALDPTSSTDTNICNPGIATLSATGSSNSFYYWYDTPNGGNIVSTGIPFTTPTLTSSQNYYLGVYDTIYSTNALDFDGIDDYIALTKVYDSVGLFSTFTVEGYVRTTVSGAGANDNWAILDFDRSEYFNLYVTGDNGRVGFSTTDNLGGTDDLYSPTPDVVNDGNWHHVAGVYDGTDKIIYIDGVEVTRVVNPHSGRPIGVGGPRAGIIGDGSEAASYNGARNSFYFQGQLKEIRVWNYDRSAAELSNNRNSCLIGNETGLELYYPLSEGVGSDTIKDYSGNGTFGVLFNMNSATDWVTDGPRISGCGTCMSAAKQTSTVTVNDPPTDLTVNISCAGDLGNYVGLLGVGGSGNYDYRETGGSFNYDAVYNTTEQYFTVNNGASYDFEVMDDNGCIFLQSSSNVPALPTIINAATSVGSCLSLGSNDNQYIVNGSNEVLMAIDDQGTPLGNVTVDAYVDANAGVYFNDAYMARHFRVSTDSVPGVGGALVRLYFTNAELSELQDSAAATPLTDDDVSSINDLGTSRYKGPTEDGVFDHTDASSLIFINQNSNGTQFGANYIEISTDSFSEFWIHASASMQPLPVELLYFDVAEEKGKALLQWATINESNNAYFILERSDNGGAFSEIARIDGNPESEGKTYTYIDQNTKRGTNYYRLSQVDFDGQRTYFRIVSFTIGSGNELKIYPNPTSQYKKTTLQYHSAVKDKIWIRVYNSESQLSRQFIIDVENGLNTIDLPFDGLPSGFYFVNVSNPAKAITIKVLID
ncbi:MAG: LamG-like jellyroll fold domain-containing protein [Cytophagales bacterium]